MPQQTLSRLLRCFFLEKLQNFFRTISAPSSTLRPLKISSSISQLVPSPRHSNLDGFLHDLVVGNIGHYVLIGAYTGRRNLRDV